MPRGDKCAVCFAAPRIRLEIEQGLISGVSVRDLADKSGVSKSTIGRHKLAHLPQNVSANIKRERAITEAQEKAREALQGTPLDDASPETVLELESLQEPADGQETTYLPAPVKSRPPKNLNGNGGSLDDFLNGYVPETPSDLARMAMGLCRKQAEIAARAESEGSLRVASSAVEKILPPFVLVCKAFGLVSEASVAGNQQVNVFQGWSPDEVRALVKDLTDKDSA